MIKKLSYIIVILLSFAATNVYALSSVNTDDYINVGKEKLTISNRKIVSKKTGNEFIMKGVSDSLVWTDFQKEKISRETFRLLKNNGFNSSRLMLFTEMFYDFNTNEFREEGFTKLKETLQNAYDEGFYIIVDMHALTYGTLHFCVKPNFCMIDENGSSYVDGFIKVWQRIAKEVKSYKSVMAYELMNEPHARFSTTQKAVLDVYTDVIQRTFNAIRMEDKDTIISFQPINGYLTTDYRWSDIIENRYPKINGDNILLDVAHVYDNAFYTQKYGVLNETPAWDTTTVNKKYKNAPLKYVTENNTSFSINIEPDVDTQLVFAVLKVYNANGSKLTIHGYRIFKEIDGNEVSIFEIKDTDSYEKQRSFSYDYLIGKTYDIDLDEKHIFGDDHMLIKNPIGIKKGEKIRLEIDVEFDKYNENTFCKLSYGVLDVLPNKDGQTLVSGHEKLLAQIKGYDEIAKEYNSPLYFGEFGIRTYLVNEYTNYKKYIDDYAILSEKYHISNNWHQMLQLSDQGSGTGYGIFIGRVPKEEAKQKDIWKYVLPKYLSVPGSYKKEEVKENNNSINKETIIVVNDELKETKKSKKTYKINKKLKNKIKKDDNLNEKITSEYIEINNNKIIKKDKIQKENINKNIVKKKKMVKENNNIKNSNRIIYVILIDSFMIVTIYIIIRRK